MKTHEEIKDELEHSKNQMIKDSHERSESKFARQGAFHPHKPIENDNTLKGRIQALEWVLEPN